MPKHNKQNESLYVFANALREVLDLKPIYQDGRSIPREKQTDEFRFYSEPYEWSKLTIDMISKSW